MALLANITFAFFVDIWYNTKKQAATSCVAVIERMRFYGHQQAVKTPFAHPRRCIGGIDIGFGHYFEHEAGNTFRRWNIGRSFLQQHRLRRRTAGIFVCAGKLNGIACAVSASPDRCAAV